VRQALLAVALVVPALGVHAQGAGDAQTFEVVSVKVRTEAGGGPNTSSPDRYNRLNTSLRGLVQDAYGLQPYEVAGGPEWATGAVRFDVMAKASSVPTRDQMRLMVQHMLRERFALRTHKETREMPTYVLRIARADGRLGDKLTKTTVDCAVAVAECRPRQIARPRPGGVQLQYQVKGIDSAEFARWLSPYLGRTVIDRTGLKGDFDFDLAFSPGGGNLGAPADENVSIFAALQEQLGLKVDADRGPVEVLIIDSAEMPTPD
jgi:uncharacterized protein (TIGR03435 family)